MQFRPKILIWYAVFTIVAAVLCFRAVEVYRAPLPFSVLQQQPSQSLHYRVHIVSSSPETEEAAMTCVSQTFSHLQRASALESDILARDSHLQMKWEVLFEKNEKKTILPVEKLIKAKSVKEVDEIFNSLSSSPLGAGEVKFFVLGDEFANLNLCRHAPFLGMTRVGWVCAKDVSKVGPFLEQRFLGGSQSELATQNSNNNNNVISGDRTQLHLSPDLRLCFSLLNENPNDHRVVWNLPSAARRYLWPTLNRLRSIMNFTVDSQHVHFASLPIPVGGGPGRKFLSAQSLHHFVNAKDWIVDPSTSTTPSFSLLLFVPSKENANLSIIDTKGNRVGCNCFSMPGFGGVVIQDAADNSPSGVTTWSDSDLAHAMSLFSSQLLRELGVKGVSDLSIGNSIVAGDDNDDESREKSKEIHLAEWELEAVSMMYLRRRVAAARHSLSSLDTLIYEIPAMMVGDSIQTPVMTSIRHIEQAGKLWSEGKIEAAATSAAQAFVVAEEAFFHPSILSLLYFPDDHKLAVYIPFFVPVLLVILRPYFILLRDRKKKKDK